MVMIFLGSATKTGENSASADVSILWPIWFCLTSRGHDSRTTADVAVDVKRLPELLNRLPGAFCKLEELEV